VCGGVKVSIVIPSLGVGTYKLGGKGGSVVL